MPLWPKWPTYWRKRATTAWRYASLCGPGGCSGYSYEMFFDSELAANDIIRTFG